MEGLNAGRSVGESGAALYRNSGHESVLSAAGAASQDTRTDSVQRGTEGSSRDRRGKEEQREAPSQAELEALVDGLNRVFESSKGIRFDISEDSGDIVVQVVDRQSDEVVRTIPPDRLAEVHRNLREMATGALLDDRA